MAIEAYSQQRGRLLLLAPNSGAVSANSENANKLLNVVNVNIEHYYSYMNDFLRQTTGVSLTVGWISLTSVTLCSNARPFSSISCRQWQNCMPKTEVEHSSASPTISLKSSSIVATNYQQQRTPWSICTLNITVMWIHNLLSHISVSKPLPCSAAPEKPNAIKCCALCQFPTTQLTFLITLIEWQETPV